MNTIDDKAKELVERYRKNIILNTPVYIGAHELHEWDEIAKEAALICVDEILKLNTWVDEDYQRNNPKLIDIEDTEEFWQKVKEKIQQL